MQSEIGVRMGLGVVGNFGEPWTGNHDAGGSRCVSVESIEAGSIFGVGDGEIIGVDNQKLRICGIAEAFGDRLGLCLQSGERRKQNKDGGCAAQDSRFSDLQLLRDTSTAKPINLYYPGSSDASGATPILVKSGEHVSADMTLTTEPAQHFKVTDPDAGQGQGMNVLLEQRVFDGFPVNVQAQAVATAPGEVEIAGVAEGHYRMQVQGTERTRAPAPRKWMSQTVRNCGRAAVSPRRR